MRSVPEFITLARLRHIAPPGGIPTVMEQPNWPKPAKQASPLAKAVERNAMNQKKKDQIKRIEAEVAELKLLIENQIDNLAKITIELGKLKAGK